MCALSAAIRAKPNWWIKAHDPDIRSKWREEAIGAPVPHGDIRLKEDEVNCVLDELLWYASRRDGETGIEVRAVAAKARGDHADLPQASIFQRIWQSDRLISDALRSGLLSAVARLEDVSEDQKDWHPHVADGQVLDLVHPSLYCIVYGHTVLCQAFSPTTLPHAIYHKDVYEDIQGAFRSERFCWLPTDFAISSDGTTATALGYINNLIPHTHASAYPVIEQLVARFVPLWERVLPESRVKVELRRNVVGTYWSERREEESESESDGKYSSGGYYENYILHLPEVSRPFQPHPQVDPVDLKGRTLQVIVKLANIILVSLAYS